MHITLPHCRAYTNDRFWSLSEGSEAVVSRDPQETNESSGTLGSEATKRTRSWTKRPFFPAKDGIYRTFPNLRLRLVRSPNANETGRNGTNNLSQDWLSFHCKTEILLAKTELIWTSPT